VGVYKAANEVKGTWLHRHRRLDISIQMRLHQPRHRRLLAGQQHRNRLSGIVCKALNRGHWCRQRRQIKAASCHFDVVLRDLNLILMQAF
jgi:hypothetical protein